MKNEERSDFCLFILGIAEVYDKKMGDAAVAIYWETLKDLPVSRIKTAVKRHMEDPESGKFMPKPADIRHYGAPAEPSALIAWSEVIDAMEKYGAYRSVMFRDGTINCVIRDMGGWPGMCHEIATAREDVWLQKEFERRYAEYRSIGRGNTEPLLGLSDIDNKNRGYLSDIKPPIMIESQQEIPQIEAGKNLKLLK